LFKLSDFWNIFNELKGDNEPGNLDERLVALCQSERVRARKLFESTLDQISFASPDYRRLRKFLIDWYAAHKTITATQRNISEISLIPPSHVDELFRSFGFDYSPQITSFVNKVNFFFDLVNLYKKKGTPSSIKDVLSYFGIGNVDIVEYMLQKDENEDLVFQGILTNKIFAGSPEPQIRALPYNSVIENDSHWFYKEEEIHRLIQKNKINLPSKTPYYAIRPQYQVGQLNLPILYMKRIVSDYYNEWLLNGTIQPRKFDLSKLNISVNILDLLLIADYVFNKYYEITQGSLGPDFEIYNGPDPVADYNVVQSVYNNIIKLPATRDEKKNLYDQYFDLFSRPLSQHFLPDKNSAGDLLQQIYPELYNLCDSWFLSNKSDELITSLIEDLGRWLRDNTDYNIPELAIVSLGLPGLYDLLPVINFFKPYRSRFIALELEYVINNALMDSIRLDDNLAIEGSFSFWDIIVADSNPCCLYPGLDCHEGPSYHPRDMYDCGSFYDVGAAFDKEVDIEIKQEIQDSIGCLTPPINPQYTIHSGYTLSGGGQVEYCYQDCGWLDFDNGGLFDCTYGRDICQIIVQDVSP